MASDRDTGGWGCVVIFVVSVILLWIALGLMSGGCAYPDGYAQRSFKRYQEGRYARAAAREVIRWK